MFLSKVWKIKIRIKKNSFMKIDVVTTTTSVVKTYEQFFKIHADVCEGAASPGTMHCVEILCFLVFVLVTTCNECIL